MQALIDFANEKGFKINDISLDGCVNRLDRNGTKNGWYVGFQVPKVSGSGNFVTAIFGDWKTGEKYQFKGNEKLSRDDSKRQREIYQQAIEKAETERKEMQDAAAKEARRIYESATGIGNFSYLTKKKINGLYGARILGDGQSKCLVVPLFNIEGEIRGIQKIFEDKKLFLQGQENKSNFFIIGDIKLETKKAYLCEGFATGATVHMATGKPVVCAFTAGNLRGVAGNIKRKWPQLHIIVAADNDKSGVGEEKGRLAASAVMGSVVVPYCTDGSDFNDLYIETGSLEAVKSSLEPDKETKDSGFTPIGHSLDNSAYYFFKNDTRSIVQISGFSETDLLKLMPSFMWEHQFPSPKGGMSKKLAIDYLIKLSDEAGVFDQKRTRGAGCWRDGKYFVYNTGSCLLSNDGENIDDIKSKYVYVNTNFMMPEIAAPSLSDSEAVTLLNACSMFRWKGTGGEAVTEGKECYTGHLLAGWLALARVAALLPKRYHIWLTGSSDIGKTEFMEKVARFVLGHETHVYFKGATTEAAIRQTMNNSNLPVVFDEFESDGQQSIERVQNTIVLLRSAFDGGIISKGTPGGQVQEYFAMFPAIVSSIRMSLDNDADRSRFFQAELMPLIEDDDERKSHYKRLLTAVANMNQIDNFSDRLFWRSFRNIEVILSNYDKLRAAFSIKCKKSRTANMFALLAAGSYSLQSSGHITEKELNDYAEKLDFGHIPEADEVMCFNHMLAEKIRFPEPKSDDFGNGTIVYKDLSIGELAGIAAKGHLTVAQVDALLRHGFKIKDGQLIICNTSPSIKKRFARTKWENCWHDVLKRVMQVHPNPEYFLGVTSRGLSKSLSYFTES